MREGLMFAEEETPLQLPAKQQDVSRDDGYPPAYTNQIFEDEEIRGYQGLEIDVAITTDTFVPLLMHRFSSKVSPANDYVDLISKHFTEGLPSTREAALAFHVRSALLEQPVQRHLARSDECWIARHGCLGLAYAERQTTQTWLTMHAYALLLVKV